MKNEKNSDFFMDDAKQNGKKGFIASRKQLQRMAIIVTMLKERELVRMKSIIERLEETELKDGAYLGCGNRTIQRDIKILQKEYGAPIEYSRKEAAYILNDKEWSFQVPALLNPDELLAVMIGGKLAQDIFPASISSKVKRALGEILRYNKSKYITSELMDSLKILPDAVAVVPDEIFEFAFKAWSSRSILRINYTEKDGTHLLRDIEPHTLVFHEMRWSIKGFCRLRKGVRTFHLARISLAQILDEHFTADNTIIASVTPDQFLDYERIEDVTIRLNEAGRQFASVYALHSAQSFTRNDDGSFTMYIPAVPLERLVPWVLRQAGDAEPLSPPAAVEAVRTAVRRLADVCQAYDPAEIKTKVKRQSGNRKTDAYG